MCEKIKIICPYCNTEIEVEMYDSGECPTCDKFYYWDDDWDYEIEVEISPGFYWE